jgi:hypothetical protein
LGHEVLLVEPGEEFVRVAENRYRLNPERAADYLALLQALEREGQVPAEIVHCWSVTPQAADLSLAQATSMS